jgi:hypothetical protein
MEQRKPEFISREEVKDACYSNKGESEYYLERLVKFSKFA